MKTEDKTRETLEALKNEMTGEMKGVQEAKNKITPPPSAP
jgi:hypothetical protein